MARLPDLIVRRIEPGSPEHDASLELRHRVMYQPFGLDCELAAGAEADDCVHVACLQGEKLIAYGRLVYGEDGGEGQIYQVVVAPRFQRMGLGRMVMTDLLDRARSRGHSRVCLDARLPAVGFYELLGFRVIGGEFVNRTGLPHVAMTRDL